MLQYKRDNFTHFYYRIERQIQLATSTSTHAVTVTSENIARTD